MDLSILCRLSAEQAARRLLGAELIREIDGEKIQTKIVETESYSQNDPASHSFRGKTKRNSIMFERAGTAYVYFTYGMHYCFNVVVGPKNHGAAVLIRALEPLEGAEKMQQLRPKPKTKQDLANGPAKLTQSLKINLDLNGHDLSQLPLKLILKKPISNAKITCTTRVGIKETRPKPHRFYITGSPFVSQT